MDGNIDVDFLIVFRHLLPVGIDPGRMRVFNDFLGEIPDSIEGYFGCFNIGLANVEMIYFSALFFSCFGKRYQLADRGFGHH